ncbi:HDOD domain-containing protein [Shewanella sp. NIFS-20-20]|uniref:HDOD domain-containing protein n=1 Tax=Shewanella sp. NIFS-20-20 TaxID=2853806 RepID=UPI001C438A7E|nr:HDOD domain-containing protein [Shewanella sp. NIFS-20-20]MBV7315985.1 HDOD domain-containing protein [Shewanella sp. NIFS-20-20]
MTELEQLVFNQIRAIMGNEEQILGRKGTLLPLKKAIIADGDIQNVIDIVASDPALAGHLLWRSNTASTSSGQGKNRSLKDALIRLGQVNIYRYAFTFYLKERLDELPQPYKKLVFGYWKLNESIAEDAMLSLKELDEAKVDADELQTISLFSVFGQIIALTAFSYLNAEAEQTIPLEVMKSIIDNEQQSLTLDAFQALDLDQDLRDEFLIAHNLSNSANPNSPGLILRRVLSRRGLLLNPL